MKFRHSNRRLDEWLDPPKVNWRGMIWWTFWFVIVFSAVAGALAATVEQTWQN